MPYSAAHKAETRSRIIETARILFNREGFSEVSIDRIMDQAGLTRGGFYNHFKTKDALYAEAVASFLNGRGKTWRDEAGVDPVNGGPATVRAMIDSYLSDQHLDDIDGQCPMIALPSDAARASAPVRSAYTGLLRAMIWLFENNATPQKSRDDALALAAMCVGGMVLARTVDDASLSGDIRSAVKDFAFSALAQAE